LGQLVALAQNGSLMAQCIAVLGAESTGKTEFIAAAVAAFAPRCAALAEPLRIFIEQHKRVPSAMQQHTLLREHIAQINAIRTTSSANYVLCDCAPITTALYSQMYYQDRSLIAPATEFHKTNMTLTLFIEPQFGWVADANPLMRDGPQAQAKFDGLLQQWLDDEAIAPVVRLTGSTQQRLLQADAAMMAFNARGPDLR
jgi:nicotinamide riboside kinase